MHIGNRIRLDGIVMNRIRNDFALRVFIRFRRMVDRVRFGLFHRVDHVVAAHDVAEDVVAAVKPVGGVERNVKLRVARVRAGVGVRDHAAHAVRQDVRIFVGDRA